MARTERSSAVRAPDLPQEQDERDLAAAASDADLQAHHRFLMCLDQTRRAQMKLAQDWTESLLVTGRMLASCPDPQRWLKAPSELWTAACTHTLAAQGTHLAAWSEFQSAVLDEVRANLGIAGRLVWPGMHGARVDDRSASPA